MGECFICGRKVESDTEFCVYHIEALENVRIAFEQWKQAMDIQWKDYLEQLLEEENIGKWAREMVEYLMQQDDSSE